MGLQLTDKKILYVDPNQQYYNLIQSILIPDVTSKQAKRISMERSVSANDAVFRIKGRVSSTLEGVSSDAQKQFSRPFDIVFCEYELGDGKTAQDLLEQLRKEHLVPLSTVFIMIAAERFRERVMSVLEYAPDSYILKGVNTADEIEKRIVKAIAERQELLGIYESIDAKDYAKALTLCNDYINSKGRLSNHVMKLRGFVYLELRDYEGAKTAYSQIIGRFKDLEENDDSEKKLSVKPPAYAIGGLAKAKFYSGETEEAESMLESLITENPDYMDGYDALSEMYSNSGRSDKAQEVLEKAVKKSPHKFDRQKMLGLVALDNEDFDTAESAFKKLTTDGKFSNSSHPENFAHLAEIQVRKGQADEALKQLRLATEIFRKTEHADSSKFLEASVSAKAYEKKGDSKRADEAFLTAVGLHKEGKSGFNGMGERMQTDFAVKLLESGHSEMGEATLESVIQNSPNKDALEKRAKSMMNSETAKAKFEALKRKVEDSLTRTLDGALASFRSGDREQGMRIIKILVTESPRNPQIIQKAAMIYLMSVSGNSDDDKSKFSTGLDYLHKFISLGGNAKDVSVIKALAQRVLTKFNVGISIETELDEGNIKPVAGKKGTEGSTLAELTKLDSVLDSIKL